MEKTVLFSISLSELKSLIAETIKEVGGSNIQVPTDDERPINQKEAARFLDISEVTIIAWKKAGKVPYEQLPGSKTVRFYKSQLRAVVQRNPHLLQAARK